MVTFNTRQWRVDVCSEDRREDGEGAMYTIGYYCFVMINAKETESDG